MNRASIAFVVATALMSGTSLAWSEDYVVVHASSEVLKQPSALSETLGVLAYGNIVSCEPVKGVKDFLKLVGQPGRYVRRQGLLPSPPTDGKAGHHLVVAKIVPVHLLPEIESRLVLSLHQGEVMESLGTARVGGRAWIKGVFRDDMDWEFNFVPLIPHRRYGWIPAEAATLLQHSTVNESDLSPEELPERERWSDQQWGPAERRRLADQGFYVERMDPPGRITVDDMVDSYAANPSPPFITTDLFFHAFHLIFDRMLQQLEERHWFPALRDFTEQLCRATLNDLARAKEPRCLEALERNAAYGGVAARLLGLTLSLPDRVEALVTRELQSLGHLDQTPSRTQDPITAPSLIPGVHQDATQYTVRGHYARNEFLSRYFRAMMWFGRTPLLISSDEATRSALLVVQTMDQHRLFPSWERLTALLTVLVGPADDWTPAQYRQLLPRIYGARPSPADFEDSAKLVAFRALATNTLPHPRIVDQSNAIGATHVERAQKILGWRLFGQRFTPDASWFQRLTYPAVGTPERPKNMPTALEVMGVLGSRPATSLLPAEWWPDVKQYAPVFNTLAAEISSWPKTAWTSTMYAGWLDAVRTLFAPLNSSQRFATSPAWGFKSLNTGLGSWTELKRDTILYVKQGYGAERGGWDLVPPLYEPPCRKGYVEPNPRCFSALRLLAERIRGEVKSRGMMSDEYHNKWLTFEGIARDAEAIARKESEGVFLTPEDFQAILRLPARFGLSLLLPEGVMEEDASLQESQTQLRMALIADTWTHAGEGILIDAIGVPQRITVAVKDASGGTRMTTGFVYSWYEWKDERRWTDEEWKALVYDKSRAQEVADREPSWYREFRK